ncbi:metal ABC transporter ATP-binding protein [Oceanospirillum linum]|uniref:Zinc ABC transporter ATP-binding protein ZnuC n=1 Tax=Oceanospirillum linum TaxID=966 RepID=A0A1T1HFE0_OCELI|nr:metal ABC transporter ATP-binding protein [Oceanospirillum linum]OOV88536.1 zinc ABC transporter ATP-binding protein ZnuC [Oceanospirillum linum]SEF59817.1 zinc transport system ATP-binding protein [Oleiphilus messinensis]SMP06731.1 zinc transport system ATP-binding protein [Oceanospirillum linum]
MLIEACNIDVQIGKKMILKSISLQIEKGRIITVIGPNGSGKSTLLKTLIGAITPVTGTLIKAPELSVGYVPQRLHIDETLPMTVKRFLQLPHKMPAKCLQNALSEAGASNLMNQQLNSLSGGQLQRVLLARALLTTPNLLLLDEPTQGLDRKGTADFYRQLNQLRQKLNCAILLVSHDLQVVMRQSDQVICLNGQICCQGKPEDVGNSDTFKTLFGLDGDGDTLALYRHHSHSRTTYSQPSANQEIHHAG